MDNTEILTVLSLCTGYGGLELGLSGALENPLRVVAVEVEAYALANLVAKAEEGKLAIEALWPDLRTFPAERFRGCFDFILAGYPCQPFSVAGKRRGTDDPRHLWPYIARIIEAVEPLWCFFENVPGHLSLGFADVYRSLRNLGYSVEAGLFTAAEVGAPHKRQRLFILAHNERMRPAQPQGSEREQRGRTINGGQAMGDAERSEQGFGTGQEPQAELGRDRCAIQREVVADDTSSGLETMQGEQKGQSTLESCREFPDAECQGLQEPWLKTKNGQAQRFPARPCEPQYEWEEPRVVGDTQHTRQGRTRRSTQRFVDRPELCAEEAQSGVGRTVDGLACRVGRLRLLGNGVVPQQAAKAFKYLSDLSVLCG